MVGSRSESCGSVMMLRCFTCRTNRLGMEENENRVGDVRKCTLRFQGILADLEVRGKKGSGLPDSRVKRNGLGYGSVVECLPSMCKILDSGPSISQAKKTLKGEGWFTGRLQ